MRIINPGRKAGESRARAAATRAEADELRNLFVSEVVWRIEAKRAEQEHMRQRTAERVRQLHNPFE